VTIPDDYENYDWNRKYKRVEKERYLRKISVGIFTVHGDQPCIHWLPFKNFSSDQSFRMFIKPITSLAEN
jgi:hypothetical protein